MYGKGKIMQGIGDKRGIFGTSGISGPKDNGAAQVKNTERCLGDLIGHLKEIVAVVTNPAAD